MFSCQVTLAALGGGYWKGGGWGEEGQQGSQKAAGTDLDPGQGAGGWAQRKTAGFSPRTKARTDFRLSPGLVPKVTIRPQQASGVPAEGKGQPQAGRSFRAQWVFCPSRTTVPQEASRRRCAAGGPGSHDALTHGTACCHHFTGRDTEAQGNSHSTLQTHTEGWEGGPGWALVLIPSPHPQAGGRGSVCDKRWETPRRAPRNQLRHEHGPQWVLVITIIIVVITDVQKLS